VSRRRDTDNSVGRFMARLLTAALLAAGAWLFGLLYFIADIPPGLSDPTAPLRAELRTDAAVVLTGGHGRLQAGFSLLEQGGAKKLFISGVYDGVAVRELLRLTAKAQDERGCCVVLGYAAGDTIGNAAETADWMEEEHFESLRLVTSNYHMPRALLEFGMAMPDVRIIPHPVASPNVHIDEWWRRRGTAHLLIIEYSKYLVALLRDRLAELLDEE
jgi:uncharacterized SAM-binding protein YcdF (DUF218 family)